MSAEIVDINQRLAAIRLASEMMSRANYMSQAGLTFGGKRDLYEKLGYAKAISPSMYRDRYKRNAIAGRVVDALPDATWRAGGELIEDEQNENLTDFEKAWIEFDVAYKAWSLFNRADRLAGLGRYAVIMIGAPGDVRTPLTTADRIDYLKPFSEELCTWSDVDDVVKDLNDPRYGMPDFYRVGRSAYTGGAMGLQARVHYSRIIHLADGLLDDDLLGLPRQERIWNDLDDLEKVKGGGAEAFWLRANKGTHFNIDPEVTIGDREREDLKDQVEKYMHEMTRAIRTRGVEIKDLGSDVADFKNPLDSIVAIISAGTGIPQRILMGSERGELASTQDEGNWEQRVSDRRRAYAEPYVVRELVDRLIELGVLPEVESYDVRWPEAMEMDDAQRVELAVAMASINKEAGETVVLPNEIRDRALGWEPIDEDELAAREEEDVAALELENEENADNAADQQRAASTLRAARRAKSRQMISWRENYKKKLRSTRRRTAFLGRSATR